MEYLIRNRGNKQKAHVWNGSDTLCRLASTGGLKVDDFSVCDSTLGHEICWMCAKALCGSVPNLSPKRKPDKKEKKRKRLERLLCAPGAVFYESKAWKRLRRQVLEKYGYKCMCCDAVDTEIHVDHIVPRSKRPDLSLTFKNLQVLCRDCNMRKWNYHSHDYRDESIARDIELQIAREAAQRI